MINHVSKHFLDKRQSTEALTSSIKNLVTFQTWKEKNILRNSRTFSGDKRASKWPGRNQQRRNGERVRIPWGQSYYASYKQVWMFCSDWIEKILVLNSAHWQGKRLGVIGLSIDNYYQLISTLFNRLPGSLWLLVAFLKLCNL